MERSIPLGHEVVAVPGVLWIQHLQNSCAAFSTCVASNGFFLLVAALVAVAVIAYELRQAGPTWMHATLGMVLGGTLGNGFDRLVQGGVTDLVALHWWPTFNIADSGITVGLLILAAGSLSGGWRPRRA